MSSTIKIYKSLSKYDFSTLQLIEKECFPSVVEDSNSNLNLEYLVLIDPENLFYSVKIPESNNYDSSLTRGEFKADLWKQDLIELFIASDQGTSYQEINLAPSGAYWTVQFSYYRTRISETEGPLAGIEIEVRTTLVGKILSLKIPLSCIIEGCSISEHSRLNCCAIIGNNPRNYFATASLNPVKPDYHDITSWGKVELVKL